MRSTFAVALIAMAMLSCSASAQETTAEGWYEKGMSLMANGTGYNLDEALQAFDKAIQIDPQNIGAWLGKAQALAYLDRKNESLDAFRDVLNLTDEAIAGDPEDAKAWQSRGIALASLGIDQEAKEAFERSVDLLNQSLQGDPEDAEAWWLKAENLELLGRSDSALEAYDRVIELNSSRSAGAWMRKSDIFYGLPGGYNQSQEAFGRAVDLMNVSSTSFISFWYPEGDHTITLNEWMIDGQIVRVDFGRYNRSLQEYDDLVQTHTNSDPFSAWRSKGRAITPQGRTLGEQSEYLIGSSINWAVYNFSGADFPDDNDSAGPQEGAFGEETSSYWIERGDAIAQDLSDGHEALAAYENAIRIDPDNLDAWDRKALILYALDQEAYRRVLNITEMRLEENPKDARAWQAQAVALASLGRQDEVNQSLKNALKIYDQEIKEDPKNATAWFYKAELTASMNGSEEALNAYDKVIELNGSMKVDALITKGNALLNLGRHDEALAAIDEAIETDPDNFLAWNERAIYYSVLGNYSEALAACEMMTDLQPENPRAWRFKGDSLKALGRQAESDAAYARAKELG